MQAFSKDAQVKAEVVIGNATDKAGFQVSGLYEIVSCCTADPSLADHVAGCQARGALRFARL